MTHPLTAVAASVPPPAILHDRPEQRAFEPFPDAGRIVTHPPLKPVAVPNWIPGGDRSSEQALGDATVAVRFEGGPRGFVITGVDLDSGFVHVDYFANSTVNAWYSAIQQELIDERAQAEDDARMVSEMGASHG